MEADMDNLEFARSRRELLLTQEQLGDQLGLSRRTVGAMERGQAPIATTTAMAVRYLLLMTRAGRVQLAQDSRD